jgi:hypothetical protein
LIGAEATARELPQLGLADALELTLLIAREEPRRRVGRAICRGILGERMMGLEPTTFCMASRRSSQLSYIRAGRSIAPAKRRLRRR